MIPTWKKKSITENIIHFYCIFLQTRLLILKVEVCVVKAVPFFLQMLSHVLALIPFLWSLCRSLDNYNCKSNLWPKCLLLILFLVINFYFKTLSYSNIQAFWLENIKISYSDSQRYCWQREGQLSCTSQN